MARYIDADVLMKELERETGIVLVPIVVPEMGVQEVVRCKDCEFRDGSTCEYSAVWVHPNGYCHWGRKEEENDKIH